MTLALSSCSVPLCLCGERNPLSLPAQRPIEGVALPLAPPTARRGVAEVVAAEDAQCGVDAVEDRAEVPGDEERDGHEEDEAEQRPGDRAPAPRGPAALAVEREEEHEPGHPEPDGEDVEQQDDELIAPGAVGVFPNEGRAPPDEPDHPRDEQRDQETDSDEPEADRGVRGRRQRPLAPLAGDVDGAPRQTGARPRLRLALPASAHRRPAPLLASLALHVAAGSRAGPRPRTRRRGEYRRPATASQCRGRGERSVARHSEAGGTMIAPPASVDTVSGYAPPP